ncbi:MAG: hypothetical protein QW775_01820 [Ignisphaera sp.]|uniref:Uncharacterized protein n=1 Tax=Ignisphaera aggregans TaxID=334771 RepID=A0A7C4NNB2_9CREN
MTFRSIILAILYRDIALFRRWFSEYVVLWTLPLVFSIGAFFLPATLFEVEAVVSRFSNIIGVELDLVDIILYAVTISAIMSMTLLIVDETINTLYQERKLVGSLQMVLEATNLRTYLLCQALIRPVILVIASTMYLPIALFLIAKVKGLIVFAYVFPLLLISGVALGLYSLLIAIPITFYVEIDRPWIIASLLMPALLAGSGIHIPIRLIPLGIKLIAYTSPLPYECEILRIMLLRGLNPDILLPTTVITIALAVYMSINVWFTMKTDRYSRKIGV